MKKLKPDLQTRILSFIASVVLGLLMLNQMLEEYVVLKLEEWERNLKSWDDH